jgi:diamine N-acetyltransferase
MHITIKIATAADAELIADLSRETFYDAFIADNRKEDMDKFLDEQFTKESLMKEVGAPGNIFLLAYSGDEVAGYARLRENEAEKDKVEIARIYNKTSAIGKGIGKSLMLACIEIAEQLQKKIIWLGVWKKNQRAIDFYSKFGFDKYDEHDFLLGDDLQTDWLMKKSLD